MPSSVLARRFSYNLGQRLCVSQGRRRALYACNGFVEPRHRHRNVSSYWMRELRRVAGAHDAALFTCVSFCARTRSGSRRCGSSNN